MSRTTITSNALEAVAGINDGATILVGGFGMAGMPTTLIDALITHGASGLTIVSNNAGNGDTGLAALLAAGRVTKVICSFPRQSDSYVFDALYRAGKVDLEVVPQGSLAERIRAAGAGISIESLATLRPIRSKLDAASTVTAGNASGQNDGAAMCIVTSRENADKCGLVPLLELRSWAVTGCAPETMGIGPVSATAAALDRAGLSLDDIGLIELNEAFAAQVLAVLAEWKIDPLDDRLNPNGSGISLGHPIGATGARILATAAHEAHRRETRFVLETMCIGGGQGLAAVFEVVR